MTQSPAYRILRRAAAALLAATLGITAASASEPQATAEDAPAVLRPVVSAFTIGIGSSHLIDTYLSPLRYSGWHIAPAYERMQAMRFDPERFVMQLRGSLSLDRALNPARNATFWDLDLTAGWAMFRRFRPAESWQILAGGSTTASVGAILGTRNSNNPVSAKASWTVNAAAAAVYNTRIFGKTPLSIRYQAELPLTGIFFSPDYGELYYEIYLGNRSGLVHAAWPGNFFRLDNYLSADFRFGGTTLRLGYKCNIFSSRVSEITTRRITHSFVVGVATEWLSLNSRRGMPAENARVISAMY